MAGYARGPQKARLEKLFYFFETPREKKAIENNEFLLSQLDALNIEMNQLEIVINELGERDDNIYRAFFGENPIGESIRIAGFLIFHILHEHF